LSLASGVAARYDRISEVYDETRKPLSEGALDRVARVLRSDGSRIILEAGVGTGRIAGPLQDRGFDVIGVDLSRGMLSKAKAKGVTRLVLADFDNPPFNKKAFDAVLLAHVLHLLEDPAQTFEKLATVAMNEIAVFLRRPDPGRDGAREEVHRAFRMAASEMGIPLASRYGTWRERYARQSEFLSKFPPTRRITIQDVNGSDTLRDYLSLVEKGGFGFASELPGEEFHRLIDRLKQTIDLDKEVRYHRVEEMLVWVEPNMSFLPH